MSDDTKAELSAEEEQAREEEQERKARARREREVSELAKLLRTYNGRSVLWRVLEACRLYSSAPLEVEQMQRMEGRRDVGLWLLNECFTSDEEAYTIMRREAQARDKREK